MNREVIPLSSLRLSVAPMMDLTDRHCRYFHRLLSRHATLYTEMVTAAAIIHGPRDRLLGFDDAEHRVVVQLGGSDPDALAKAAKIAEAFGYNEINLNVGFGQLHAGWAAVDHTANGWAVGFTKVGDGE